MTDLLQVLNQSSLEGEFPDDAAVNDDKRRADPLWPPLPGEAQNVVYTVAPQALLPTFAQEYVDVYGSYQREMVSVMHMLANGLCRDYVQTLECTVTPHFDELEYDLHMTGSDAVIFLAEHEGWGIAGREVIAQWLDLYREKYGDSVVHFRLCEA